MLRLCRNAEGEVTTYRLGFWSISQVVGFGPISQAQAIGKALTKAEAYRACFKDFLLNNQDMAKAFALGRALTRQEFRYFKQAYRVLPDACDPDLVFGNYLEVIVAYAYARS